ncbi:DNA methyltransferase [Candidatus Acidianus copahuensis]|uniref:site-specific DNA-methyltransferase (adenine-specific) n=1 Tax=Candidatus Acidianus copahuensis TaxID=1160895 RepID=A0A031LU19_9CREN|nr:DNA adenine methylase [Candidatus Acidianus copahuensis]EZQ10603.1 DNA methyltransferase [Candidatus Acidianus copahuensis]
MARDTENIDYYLFGKVEVEPILKWAGGKRQLIPFFIDLLPESFEVYYEPFVGGGALLTSLYNMGLIRKAVISDTNADLINLYKLIKEKPNELIEEINRLNPKNTADFYYRARKEFNSIKEFNSRKGALLIYLNRHCYNGLWRVNSRGEFNVPFGRYKNPSMPSKEKILAFHTMLSLVDIRNEDFEYAVKDARRGDFVYFDPPYFPVSETANFTSYVVDGFSYSDQVRLSRVMKELDRRGVQVMLSNSDVKEIRDLYSEFKIYSVEANRFINSDPNKRKGIREIIVLNYEVKRKLAWWKRDKDRENS